MLKRIRDPDIWRVYKTILLVGTAYGLGGAVLGLHLDALGYHERAIGSLAVWFAVGLVLLSIPAGRLVARWGAKRTLVAALAGYAASVSVFPLFTSYAPIAVVRFIDGACSACLWVSCETILLRRSDPSNTGHVMSVYAMAMAIGYMLGPLAANVLTGSLPLGAAFVAAGVIAAVSATYVALRLEPDAVDVARVGSKETQTEHAGGPRASAVSILARIKTSCFAMFRERYQYSNAGFAIAGEMVARAEGTSYSALLDARILGPLGMRDTALVTSGSPGAAQQLVPGYLGDSVPGPMRAGEGSGARRLASVTGWIDSDVMAPGGPSEHGAGHGAVGTTAERAWSLQRAPPRAARELRRARDPPDRAVARSRNRARLRAPDLARPSGRLSRRGTPRHGCAPRVPAGRRGRLRRAEQHSRARRHVGASRRAHSHDLRGARPRAAAPTRAAIPRASRTASANLAPDAGR